MSREEVRRSIYDSVASGHLRIAGEQDGENTFDLTVKGRARAIELIDEAIEACGEERAGEGLALRLDLPLHIGESLVAHRLAERQR